MERLDAGAPGTGSENDDICEPRDDDVAAPGGGVSSIEEERGENSNVGRKEGKDKVHTFCLSVSLSLGGRKGELHTQMLARDPLHGYMYLAHTHSV